MALPYLKTILHIGTLGIS
jgi:hypothetical protein